MMKPKPRLPALLLVGVAVGALGLAPASAAPVATAGPSIADPFDIVFEDAPKRSPAKVEIVRGLAVVPVVIGGREANALLDNQIDISLVSTRFARAAGLPLVQQPGSVHTGDGEVKLQRVDKLSVTLPGQMRFVKTVAAADLSPMDAVTGRKIDLVIGGEFFSNLYVAIGPQQSRLFVGPSGAIKPAASTAFIPVTGARPHVDVLVNGHRLSLVIDLGFDGEIALSPAVWTKVVPADAKTIKQPVTTLNGKPFEAPSAAGQTVSFGPLGGSSTTVSQRPIMPGEDGYVGMGLLSKAAFILDTKAGRLWIFPDGVLPG